MHYLSWLDPVIALRTSSGVIGPVAFVRASFELSADHGLLARIAAAALESAARWMNSEAKSVYSQGSPKDGYISITVEFANGACALLSAEAAHSEPAAQLLLVGRNGTLRYDDFPQPDHLREPPAASAASIAWIEEAMRAGKPVLRRSN